MKRIHKNYLVLTGLILLVSAIPFHTQSDGNTPQSAQASLKIAVSIVPQIEWVNSVGGDHVEAGALIPAGQSPHSYEPTSTDLIFMADAVVWFQIGLTDYEIANEEAIVQASIRESEVLPPLEVVNLSVGLDLIDSATHELDAEATTEEGENLDPHIWLSPTRVISMVETIRDTLIELDPTNSAEYTANSLSYIAQLNLLNTSISEKLATVQNRHLLIFHPSWGYFCEDYDLEQIPLEEGGKDPTSSDLAEVIDLAREYNVGTIFIQEEISEKVAQAFAEEACVEIVELSPLALNYVENLNQTADILVEKLDQAPECTSNGIPGFSIGIFFLSTIGTAIVLYVIIKQEKKQKR